MINSHDIIKALFPRCAKSPDFAQKQSKVRRLRIADSFVFIIYKL